MSHAAAPLALRAGPLTMQWEPDTGFLRFVRLGGREVLRAVYAAVRDRHWGTVAPRIAVVECERTDDGFRLAFDAEARDGDAHFGWRGTLSGAPDGTVHFAMDGRARAAFLSNRIGFCVLHPAACAGAPCVVEHADGRREPSRFPEAIAPHQPFLDVRAIAHEAAPGVRVRVRCEGDVFETEDQRNWTDASFKTYCTPLARPFPVRVGPGAVVRQSVTLTLDGRPDSAPRVTLGDDEVALRLDAAEPARLPRLGLALADHARPLGSAATARLRALGLAHLRVELPLADAGLAERLRVAVESARAVGAPWEAALFVTDDAEAELRRLRAALDALGASGGWPGVARWLVFRAGEPATRPADVALAREALAGAGPGGAPVLVGGGTDAFFAELNRGRPPAGALDVVCYSVNPQVHAFDDLSLVETLPMQGETVRNARRIGGAPVAVTPVTLRPRPAVAGAPAGADPRQDAPFGAAWTLGSIASLAAGGADSATYYEAAGPRGVAVDHQNGPGVPGAVRPAYHVLADLAGWGGGEAVPLLAGDPPRAAALMLRHAARSRLLVANLTAGPLAVRAPRPTPGRAARLRRLDAATLAEAAERPDSFRAAPGEDVALHGDVMRLELAPYAYVCVDGAA